jgi:hypothetical protein
MVLAAKIFHIRKTETLMSDSFCTKNHNIFPAEREYLVCVQKAGVEESNQKKKSTRKLEKVK